MHCCCVALSLPVLSYTMLATTPGRRSVCAALNFCELVRFTCEFCGSMPPFWACHHRHLSRLAGCMGLPVPGMFVISL